MCSVNLFARNKAQSITDSLGTVKNDIQAFSQSFGGMRRKASEAKLGQDAAAAAALVPDEEEHDKD